MGSYFGKVPAVNPSVAFGASSLWQGSRFAPGIVTLQKAWFHTSLREGGGLGRSPKTEGASGRKGDWTVGGGTSPGLSGFCFDYTKASCKIGTGNR